MEYNLSEILLKFGIVGNASRYGDGHINDTYITDDGKYILQRINGNVFKSPDDVMNNIVAVTKHMRESLKKLGRDYERETMTVISTVDGKPYYLTENGDFFRVYLFISDTVTYQAVEDPEIFYNAAKAFGEFQKMIADFPADKLNETIKNFHNTKVRYENFTNSVAQNKSGRAEEVAEEIKFVTDREHYCDVVNQAIKEKTVPLRVTHNDTKLNNVLMDKETGKGVCVIDLDTVMPGSLLYDYGDSLRFGTNTAKEDEADLSKVSCSLEYFEAFTKGFMEVMKDTMTEKEIDLLPFSAILMTFECGMRFLADHIDGDIYFRTSRPNHNLDRARNQFKLVYDMEQKLPQMKEIVNKYR
ncbi:MAG: aminoglycoside phosphotransferase family protein [Clostridia bacterium]|nr:aminoglycoside phosphotransferase family protein [Clostridia bacterium]MBQ4543909.1 aminoglycoside phosphotransferase family protein [Clostridia bacterium]